MDVDPLAENNVSEGLVNFFLNELKDIFWAEKHLAKLFQKMQKAAAGNSLKITLADYVDSIESQFEKLKQIFEILGETPRGKGSELMTALAEEAKKVIEHTRKESDRNDAHIISAAQKIQNHKIASYDTLIQLAVTLGNDAVIPVLEEALSVEKQAIALLNNITESNIDPTGETKAGKTALKDSEEQAATVYDSINLTGKHTKE